MIPSKIRGFRSRVINALIDCIRAQRPVAGKGVVLQRTPTGTIISSTATGGDITITPAAEKILPLTIRKFTVEQASSSGTTTVTKWGLYFPDNCIRLHARDTANNAYLEWNTYFSTHATFAENAYLPDHPDWLDISNEANSAIDAEAASFGLEITLEGGTTKELQVWPRPIEDGQFKASDNGYIIPLIHLSYSNGKATFNQANFGPLFEESSTEGAHLMERPKSSSSITAFTPVEDGAELSADKTYALVGQVYMRLKYCDSTGAQFLSLERRHQTDWLDLDHLIYLRPLAFANFGAIVS